MTIINFKKFVIVAALAFLAFWVVRQAYAVTLVTICHATGSQQNPYVLEVVSSNAVDGVGPGDHNQSSHQGGQDIIPPGIWDVTGRNWTTSGQAIWNNNCNVPQPTVVPTSTPTVEPTATPTSEPEVTPTQEPTPTPTDEVNPTPTEQPRVTPTQTPSTPHEDAVLTNNTTNTPRCENGDTVNMVANAHVWRNGADATVNFFITEGDSANIYYREEGANGWTHSVLRDEVRNYVNSDKYVSYTIHGLNPDLGYDFGIEQTNGCAGGNIISVVVDGPQPRLFMFSFWEWMR